MKMLESIEVLNDMVKDGIIGCYAISGAVAAYNYVEASFTEDLDILVSLDDKDSVRVTGLVSLGPIVSYLANRGYSEWRNEGLMIGGWAVQFLPVANDLDAEALDRAEEVELFPESPLRTRILRPEHLVAIAVKVGRPKDRLRVVAFLTENAVEPGFLCPVLERHGLTTEFQKLCDQVGIQNPCVLGFQP